MTLPGKLEAILAAVGSIAKIFGLSGAAVLGSTLIDLLRADGFDTRGKSAEEILIELEVALGKAKQLSKTELDKLAEYWPDG